MRLTGDRLIEHWSGWRQFRPLGERIVNAETEESLLISADNCRHAELRHLTVMGQ